MIRKDFTSSTVIKYNLSSEYKGGDITWYKITDNKVTVRYDLVPEEYLQHKANGEGEGEREREAISSKVLVVKYLSKAVIEFS